MYQKISNSANSQPVEHHVFPLPIAGGKMVYVPRWRRGNSAWNDYSDGKGGIKHFKTIAGVRLFFISRGVRNYTA